MTHEYTILYGGLVLPGGDGPGATAIAWAEDTILAIGTDDEVRSISRGDSRFAALDGGRVMPAGDEPLEVGGRADLLVFSGDPRVGSGDRPVAVIRSGRIVEGVLPGVTPPAEACAVDDPDASR